MADIRLDNRFKERFSGMDSFWFTYFATGNPHDQLFFDAMYYSRKIDNSEVERIYDMMQKYQLN